MGQMECDASVFYAQADYPSMCDEVIYEYAERLETKYSLYNGFDSSVPSPLFDVIEEANRRHLSAMQSDTSIYERRFGIALFDYDYSLMPASTPLSEEAAQHLILLLRQGTHVAIQTLQSMNEHGVLGFTVKPLLSVMERRGEDVRLLQQLHLLPYEGVRAYGFRPGSLKPRLIYDVGFSASELERLCSRVVEAEAGRAAMKVRVLDTFVSLQYPERGIRDCFVEQLRLLLGDFQPSVRFTLKDIPERSIYGVHIKLRMATKALGRQYMLKLAKGLRIPREEILVAGDDMGLGGTDHQMLCRGGVNLNLGIGENPLAYSIYRGRNSDGLHEFLSSNLMRGREVR